MIFYHGSRLPFVRVAKIDGPVDKPVITDLPVRLDLDNHSPDGFNWGYGGSGPAQLALALIADATGDDQLAIRLHQAFKFRVVANMPADWTLSRDQVLAAVEILKQQRSAGNAS